MPRPCPRKLYDQCPIPRELCSEDYERTKVWHCLEFLRDLESFLFTDEAKDDGQGLEEGSEVRTVAGLMQSLEDMDEAD